MANAARDGRRKFRIGDLYTPTWVCCTLTLFILICLLGTEHNFKGDVAYGFPFYFIDARESSHFNGLKLLLDIIVLLAAPIVVGAIVQRTTRNVYLLLADGPPRLHLSTLIVVTNCMAIDLLLNTMVREQTYAHVAYGWPLRSVVFPFGRAGREYDLPCEFINIATAVLIALGAAFICEWRIYRKRVNSGADFTPSAILTEKTHA